MNPKIEELRKKRDEAAQELEQLENRHQQLLNRLHYFEAGQRKARTHRLIERGAVIESIWPEVEPLTKDNFYRLMKRVLSRPEAKDELRKMVGGDP